MKSRQNVCIDNQKTGKDHQSETRLGVSSAPEVFTLNLNWDGEPLPTQILRMMVTIPEKFKIKNLFDQAPTDETYVLKGLICYMGAHYLAFFRRMLIKLDYLALDPTKI